MNELLNKKIETVKEHKEDILAAFNFYLDNIYSILENSSDIDNNIQDESLKKFINELHTDTEKYEKLRQKIQNDDYNLSMFEINLIGLQFFYLTQTWEKNINDLTKAIDEAKNLIKIFLEPIDKVN